MKPLYPELQPFNTFFLETDSEHAVYVEQSGNPNGIPVVFLHGGPCSGTKPQHRCFFNPELYHIILFDQRGCGNSMPFGLLENNTTQDLLDDMERIRNQLGISQWLVFGGSWGGTLALLYAQAHADKVLGLIIRAVFLARQKDMDWFIKDGVNRIYPEQWQALLDCLPAAGHNTVLQSIYELIWGEDELAKLRVSRAWMAWNAQAALGPLYQTGGTFPDNSVGQVRMELHYARHNYFIAENQILDNCHAITGIPTRIIHGRQDFLCPLEAGMKLHQALPDADYVVLPNAGHVAQHEEMIAALVAATDDFADKHGFGGA